MLAGIEMSPESVLSKPPAWTLRWLPGGVLALPGLPAISFICTAARGAFKSSLSLPCLTLRSGFSPPTPQSPALPTPRLLYLLFPLRLAQRPLGTPTSSLCLQRSSSPRLGPGTCSALGLEGPCPAHRCLLLTHRGLPDWPSPTSLALPRGPASCS